MEYLISILGALSVQNCAKTSWDMVFTLQMTLSDSEWATRLFVRGSNSN